MAVEEAFSESLVCGAEVDHPVSPTLALVIVEEVWIRGCWRLWTNEEVREVAKGLVEEQVSVCRQAQSQKAQIEYAVIQSLSLDSHSTQTPFVAVPVWGLWGTAATLAVVLVTVDVHVLPISASVSVVVSPVIGVKQF